MSTLILVVFGKPKWAGICGRAQFFHQKITLKGEKKFGTAEQCSVYLG